MTKPLEIEQIHTIIIDGFGAHGIRDPTTTNEQAMQLPGAGLGATIKVNQQLRPGRKIHIFRPATRIATYTIHSLFR
jgi:hypothetical protein